jgi:peptide subunit release factor 1 (eRF1)
VAQQTIPLPAQPPQRSELLPLLQRLAEIPSGSYRIVSCYLRLEPRDRTRSAYRTEFRTRKQTLARDPIWAALNQDQRSEVERDLSRIDTYLDHPRGLPHARGLAIFACEALHLFETVPLFRVHRTRLILDDTPWIAELAAAERESEPMLAAVIDRAHARFFEVSASEDRELPGLAEPSTRGGKYHSDRHGSPGWGERDYHGRLQEERHRRYAHVVTHLQELLHGRMVRGLVLAGPSDQTGALARFLPEPLGARVMGTIKLNPTAVSSAEVQTAALDAAAAHDRRQLRKELTALEGAYGTGWATDGPRETLRALHRGQARTLFIREDLTGAGYRCSTTGRLVLSQNECRDEGKPKPVRDIVDEAIEEALAQRIQVRFVPDMPEAGAVDGMAAILRFR